MKRKVYGEQYEETKPGPDTEEERNQMVLEIIRAQAGRNKTSDLIDRWINAVMERRIIT